METVNPKSTVTTSADDVLITSELSTRPSRAADYEAQSQAMLELNDELRVNPGGVMQKVVELALRLCKAGSAGISILEPGQERDVFRWPAIAGEFATNLSGGLPRDASPCGTAFDRRSVLLFKEPDRHYSEMRGVTPRIHESLLAPWPANGDPCGTLWVLAHEPSHHFDAEDARMLETLARFASAAYQTAQALEKAKDSQTELEKRVEESAFLLSEAFKVLRSEMAGREQADVKRKVAEMALRENEKQAAMGSAGSVLAQQMNSPLDEVSNLLYMAEYAASVPEARKYLARAQRELVHMGRLAKGAIKADRRSGQAARVIMGELLDSALSMHEARIRDGRIDVERRYRPQRPLICIAGGIRQVAVNLVSNAIEAMKESAQRRLLVRVCAIHGGKTGQLGLRVTVADTGVGMSAAVKAEMFEPFFSAWEPPGAGLGLWVSQEIVRKHKGAIKVRSSRNGGTVMAVFLPYLEPKG